MSDAPPHSETQEPLIRPEDPLLDKEISEAIECLLDDESAKWVPMMIVDSKDEEYNQIIRYFYGTPCSIKELAGKVEEMLELAKAKSEAELSHFFKNDGGLNLARVVIAYSRTFKTMRDELNRRHGEYDISQALAALIAGIAMAAKEGPKE